MGGMGRNTDVLIEDDNGLQVAVYKAPYEVNLFFQNCSKVKKGAKILNLDLTIICQEPKISDYKSDIKKELSRLLNIPSAKVNIKATTTENLGFLGRKEGIACQAIVSVLMSVISD